MVGLRSDESEGVANRAANPGGSGREVKRRTAARAVHKQQHSLDFHRNIIPKVGTGSF